MSHIRCRISHNNYYMALLLATFYTCLLTASGKYMKPKYTLHNHHYLRSYYYKRVESEEGAKKVWTEVCVVLLNSDLPLSFLSHFRSSSFTLYFSIWIIARPIELSFIHLFPSSSSLFPRKWREKNETSCFSRFLLFDHWQATIFDYYFSPSYNIFWNETTTIHFTFSLIATLIYYWVFVPWNLFSVGL